MIVWAYAWLPQRIWNLAGQGCHPTALRPSDTIRPRYLLSDNYPPHFRHGGHPASLISPSTSLNQLP